MWEWLRRYSRWRAARKILRAAFADPDLLRGTSLKPRHAARWVIRQVEADGEGVRRIWFGILRHPRPYAFSRQSHKVLESYVYDVANRRMTRLEGRNITRAEGRDAD